MVSSSALFTAWDYLGIDQAGQATATLSGGSWVSGMGVSCLQTRYLADNARTTDTQPASCVVNIDLPEPRLVQAAVVIGHNLSKNARWRWTGWSDAGRTVPYPGADTGWVDVFPGFTPMGENMPENANWFSGKPEAEDLDRITPTAFEILPRPKFSPYFKVEFDDQANPDGYLDLGQLMLSPVVQTSINFLYGSNFGCDSGTTYRLSKGGVKFFDTEEPFRVAGLQFEHLKNDEAWYTIMKMRRRLGKDREFFACLMPSDLVYRQQFSFRCHFEDLSRMTFKLRNSNAIAFELREAL